MIHPEKLKIGCQGVLFFNRVVTLELQSRSCMVNSKAMSPYCKKNSISFSCSDGLQAFELFVSGADVHKRLSTWAGGNWYNGKEFSMVLWGKPYNSSNSGFTLKKAFCDFCNCSWKLCRAHTLRVFLLSCLKWVGWNTPNYSHLRFISSFMLSSFSVLHSQIHWRVTVNHIHFFIFGSYTSGCFLVLFIWGRWEEGNGKRKEENVCVTSHNNFCWFVFAYLRSDYGI